MANKKVEGLNLESLFNLAQQYGNITLYQSDKREFSAKIVFSTVEYTALEAHSGFGNTSIKKTLIKVIKNAMIIVGEVENITIDGRFSDISNEVKLIKI